MPRRTTFRRVGTGTPESPFHRLLARSPIWHRTGDEPATDLTRALQQRRVMTDAWPGTSPVIIFYLFVGPHLGYLAGEVRPNSAGNTAPKAMFSLLAPWGGTGLHCTAYDTERRQMISPIPGVLLWSPSLHVSDGNSTELALGCGYPERLAYPDSAVRARACTTDDGTITNDAMSKIKIISLDSFLYIISK